MFRDAWQNRLVGARQDDFTLTMEELRVVAGFVTDSAQDLLPVFERNHPADGRPRAALDAAREFIGGQPRSKLQRVASMDAHRAAASADTEAARLAARAAGDAASAAYVHPLAQSAQVGHILRAAAIAARVAELTTPEDTEAGIKMINDAARRATPVLIDVLKRYPPASTGANRVAKLMCTLDACLRTMPERAL